MKVCEFVIRRTVNFGTAYILSTTPLNGNFTSFKTNLKNLKKKNSYFGTFFVAFVRHTRYRGISMRR